MIGQRRSKHALLVFESVFSKVHRKSIPPTRGESHFRKMICCAAPRIPREEFSIFDWPKAVKYGLAGVCKIIFVPSLEIDSPPAGGGPQFRKINLCEGSENPTPIFFRLLTGQSRPKSVVSSLWIFLSFPKSPEIDPPPGGVKISEN